MGRGGISVCRAVTQTVSDGVSVKSTKTGTLDGRTIATLKALQRAQRQQRLALGPEDGQGAASPRDDYIAATPIGELIEPGVFANAFRTLTKHNKLTHITPHVL
jgi:hypothetical protein